MPGRVHSREFKLLICRQIANGEKRPAQICREHSLDQSVLTRWRREYQERGEEAAKKRRRSGEEAAKNRLLRPSNRLKSHPPKPWRDALLTWSGTADGSRWRTTS
jgi:transposase-like protein